VSDECKDLIKRLLTMDPAKRITGKGALEHAWFTRRLNDPSDKASLSNVVIKSDVLQRLQSFKGVTTF